jgi:Zn-dependent protease
MIGIGYWIGAIVGLVLHEVAHLCLAHRLGLRVKRVGISWRGPYIVREAGSAKANAIVSAAGPWINLVLAAMFWGDWRSFAFANLVLGLSNLFPTRNSDGGRIWRALPHLGSSK